MFLALGDCNLLGANAFQGKTYVQRLSEMLQTTVINCGHTMTTTREGLRYFEHNKGNTYEFVIIAYGLVDSWETFKYAPYVLYYPDNAFRKIGRSFVKKYKKITRNMGFPERFGTKNVVPAEEYRGNIEAVVRRSRRVFLVETIFRHEDCFRNKEIVRYNSILKDIAYHNKHVDLIEIYNDFFADPSLYFDSVHMNDKGYALVTEKFAALL